MLGRKDRKRKSSPWTFCERTLLAVYLSAVFGQLAIHWGKIGGFDGFAYLLMFKKVHWLSALPALYSSRAAYHPPLPFLLARPLLELLPSIPATQLFASFAMAGSVLLLRATLLRLRLLPSLPGILFLYVAAALPTYAFLSIETGNDSLAFFWCMAVLFLSVSLFWESQRTRYWKQVSLYVFLTLSLAAGLLTKYNCFLLLAVPFVIIVVRRHHLDAARRHLFRAFLICTVACSLVSPYYIRNLQSVGTPLPVAMEWERSHALAKQRTLRDEHPFLFLAHLLRIPLITSAKPPIDSLFFVVWSETWRRSITYEGIFLLPLVMGTFLFFASKNRPSAWTDLGWVLFVVAILNLLAILKFAYAYPLFDWGVFKAKYIAPALLWIPYTLAITAIHLDRTMSGKLSKPHPLAFFFLPLFLSSFLFFNYPLGSVLRNYRSCAHSTKRANGIGKGKRSPPCVMPLTSFVRRS